MRHPRPNRAAVAAFLMLATGACAPNSPALAPLSQDTEIVPSQNYYLDFWFDLVATRTVENDVGAGLAQTLTILGREDLLIAGKPDQNLPDCEPLDEDPIDAIIDRARNTNIIIINEDHAAPRHRAFIAELLTALRPLGYEFYAAETFANGVDYELPDAGIDLGYYTVEPEYGRAVTTALELGYKLVAYEITKEQNRDEIGPNNIGLREQAQADNLMAAIFSKTPDAKVLIHVGHGHNSERSPNPESKGMMAQRLNVLSGVDALTVDQTSCRASGASIVASTTTNPNNSFLQTDLRIGHPDIVLRDGRPAWRQDAGQLAAPVPAPFLGQTEPVIIEARKATQSLKAIPADRLLLRPGEQLPLLLFQGRYRIDAFTNAGRIGIPPVELIVEPANS